jgi:cyclic pyranopterin phosphate synthase
MSADDIVEFAEKSIELGIKKIRVTGGEPLYRPDVVEICQRIAAIPGIQELAVTTNGLLLKDMVHDLKQAGVSRLNISLDTLKADKYYKITRRGRFQDVMAGIQAAVCEGLTPIKINTVLIGKFNDDEVKDFAELTRTSPVEVRFIELMPIGACASFPEHAFIKGESVLEQLPDLVAADQSGVARMYRFLDGCGHIGIISAVNQHFCLECNRIRLTCDGKIKPCLHSAEEINILGLHGAELKKVIADGIFDKPAQHVKLNYGFQSETMRCMNQIGG